MFSDSSLNPFPEKIVLPRPWSLVQRTRIALIGFVAALVACSDPAAPARPAIDSDRAVSPATAFDDFINAQGSYCDDDTIPCGAPPYDIGFIPCYGDPDPNAPCFSADFGGVNARYWAKNGLQPTQPAFAARGSVTESLMPDGRRRLKATVRSSNSFMTLYTDASGDLALAPVLGADFFEYPFAGDPFDGIPDVPPLPGAVSAEIDVILPPGYSGQPDMLAIWAGVLPAEVIRWRVGSEVAGVLRYDYNGIAGGTPVRLTASYDWRGGLGAVTRIQLVPTGSPTVASRPSVTRLPRVASVRAARRVTR